MSVIATALHAPPRPLTTRPASCADVEIVALTVSPGPGGLEQVCLNAWPIGYLYRADRVYVALFGARADHALESGQFVDRGAAILHLLDEAQPRRARRPTPPPAG